MLIPDGEDHAYVQVEVPTRRLDHMVLPDGDLVAIKMDAEGHEDHIIRGARSVIEQHRPVIFIEWNTVYHARRGQDLTHSVDQAMRGLDYRTLHRSSSGWRAAEVFHSPRALDDLVLAPREFLSAVRRVLQ